MSNVVYRHYQTAAELAAYLEGRWAGSGTHGRLELPLDEEVHCVLQVRRGDMELLGTARKRDFFSRVRAFFKAGKARLFSRKIGLSEAVLSADLAEIRTEGHRLVMQAMTQDRMHLLLETAGSPPVLEFSGVIHRK